MPKSSLLPLGLAAIIAAGCGGAAATKTGAAGAARGSARPPVTVLRVETSFGVPGYLQAYANAVARATHGSLAIHEVPQPHPGDPTDERDIVADVRAGRTPLAVVGARVWDTLGLRDFQPLVAPFLITSYAQEERVLQAPFARRLLTALDRLHLTGLAFQPGPFRRMLGIHTTYLAAADFHGTRVGIQDSDMAAATMRALGATPTVVAPQTPVDQLDGYEQQLESISGNGFAGPSRPVTTNLVLWTRPLVIFGNPHALAHLTPAQRRALLEAGPQSLPTAMAAVVTADRDAAAQLCRADVPLKLASPAGLRSIEQAVQPVYRTLDADPATRGTLAAIRALRASGVSHQGPTCAPSHVPAGKHTPLDGTYRRSATQRQVARHFHIAPASVIPENYGDFALVMDRGRFASTQHNTKACTWQAGRVSITGARIEFDVTSSGGVAPTDGNNKPGERFVAKPQLYHDTLTLHPITPTDIGTIVWLRTTQHPLASALDARCHPPATALPH